jgi:hypothetical protein
MLTDAQARTIACSWHGGGGSALYAMCSTGAIDTARSDHDTRGEVVILLWSEDDEMADDDYQKMQELEDYILLRGKRGPVPGWAKLWDDEA